MSQVTENAATVDALMWGSFGVWVLQRNQRVVCFLGWTKVVGLSRLILLQERGLEKEVGKKLFG